jgi:tRNA threonylcarbamoyl adenosine modification protein (Sua5/YciO/YrdC/YwlC family)
VDEAVAAVRAGSLIVIPTDTVYGIAARPDDPGATRELFEAKGRPSDLTLPVLAATAASARTLGVFDELADELAASFWPGALTLVLPRTRESRGWELGGDRDTIGVRVPRHPLALVVLARSGPLAATSANRSGEPEATTCDELTATFGDRVAVYLCEDAPVVGSASTVVDLAHGTPRILRAGPNAADVGARLGVSEGRW